MEKARILPRKNLKVIILIVSLIMGLNYTALARSKHSKNRAYSYFDDGGKSTQANCDPERKVPRKLKKEIEFKKAGNYLGSEPVESELQPKDGPKMRKHFFSAQAACEKYLAQQQKSYELKNGKLPNEKPADDGDLDDEDTEDEEGDAEKSE